MHVRLSSALPAAKTPGSFASYPPAVSPAWRAAAGEGTGSSRRRGLLASAALHLAALAALLTFGFTRRLPEPEPLPAIDVVMEASPTPAKQLPPARSVPPAAPPEAVAPPPPDVVASPPAPDFVASPPPDAAPSVVATPPSEPVAPMVAPPPPIAAALPAPARLRATPPPVPASATAKPPPARAIARPAPPPVRPAPRAEIAAPASPRAISREPSVAPREEASERPAPPVGAESAPLVPPRPISGISSNRQPNYPESALRRGIEGRVVLRVDVSASGEATSVSILRGSGSSSLDEAALTTVRGWRFVPASRNGAALAGIADVPIDFHIAQ